MFCGCDYTYCSFCDFVPTKRSCIMGRAAVNWNSWQLMFKWPIWWRVRFYSTVSATLIVSIQTLHRSWRTLHPLLFTHPPQYIKKCNPYDFKVSICEISNKNDLIWTRNNEIMQHKLHSLIVVSSFIMNFYRFFKWILVSIQCAFLLWWQKFLLEAGHCISNKW